MCSSTLQIPLHSQLERSCSLREPLMTNEQLRLSIVSNFSFRFWYDAIRVMRSVNRKCNKPLALWTMLMEYRGLSRTGRMLASAVYGSLPVSTYDKYKKNWFMSTRRNDSLSNNLALVTIDNYSHFYNSASLVNPVARKSRDSVHHLQLHCRSNGSLRRQRRRHQSLIRRDQIGTLS